MIRQIFPISLADNFKSKAGEKYRPSNGTEGEIFFGLWCRHCARDKAMRDGYDLYDSYDDEKCEIIGKSMEFNVDEEEFPHQWTYDLSGQPCCTAFIPVGTVPTVFRDPLTVDMFQEHA